MRLITAFIALALVLAGCGSAHPASSSSPPTSIATCTIYAQAHDARITVAGGDGTSECDTLIQNFSGDGTFWSYQATAPQEGGWGQVCDVFSGSLEAVVYDDGDQIIGQEVCSNFTSAGWTEQQTQGPLAQQLARQLNQQEQAQASASAAVGQAQQVASLQAKLTTDIGTLASDAAALDNDKSLANDVQSMKNDLASEQTDYGTVQDDSCASDERGGDADTVGGDADTVGGDLDTLNGDITDLQNNAVSSDISAVQGDVSQLKQLGGSPATDPTAALAAGNKALKDTNSAIGWAQGQGASINGQAQQVANEAQALAAQCGQ